MVESLVGRIFYIQQVGRCCKTLDYSINGNQVTYRQCNIPSDSRYYKLIFNKLSTDEKCNWHQFVEPN